MDGIFNIAKATGMTSHDVVASMRKLLKQKRIGHAGTLDPAASGVLPICVGQGTRVAEYLSESGKAYEAEIVFGIVTDTYDREGVVVRTASTDGLTLDSIQGALHHFPGAQMQLPPRYSAIKLQGQPAYKRARAGEEVLLEARPIVIEALEVVDWQVPRLTLAIECSKGTYIRSLAYDLGERLGCGAHLGALVRTRSGPFLLADSVTLEQLAAAVDAGTVEHYLYPADTALRDYPALVLDPSMVERVLHGNAFIADPAPNDQATASAAPTHMLSYGVVAPLAGARTNIARVYDNAGHFLAIATWDAEAHMWQPKKVLFPPGPP